MASKLRAMSRQATPDRLVHYNGITLGRCKGRYWAWWHKRAGWQDTHESSLHQAKRYVDWLQDYQG